MMFICSKCNIERKFDHTDYYDFDIYICPNCGDEFAFPADGYGDPDDDFNEPFDEPGEDDDFLWDEDLDDDGVYKGDAVIHAPYDDEDE